MEVNEVGTGRGNDGGQQAQQFHGSQHQVGGAIRRGAFKPVGEAAVITPGEALQREGATGTIATEPCQVVPVVGMRVRVGVQGEAFEEGAAALAWRWVLGVAGEGQAPLDGCRLEGLEGVLGEGVLVQPAEALEQAYHPLSDGTQQ